MKIKSILVSQPKPADISKTPFADMIKKYGVSFTFEKFIKLDDVTASELRQEHIKLPEYTAIILTAATPSTISLEWPRKCATLFPKR